MENSDTLVAVFTDHPAAEAAVITLTAAGFEMTHGNPIFRAAIWKLLGNEPFKRRIW